MDIPTASDWRLLQGVETKDNVESHKDQLSQPHWTAS